jgi:FemAB-related protein (PEP-CTERM system-associated)
MQAGGSGVRVSVVEFPDACLCEEVRAFHRAPPPGANPLAEHDPRWLDVLSAGLRHRTFGVLARRTDRPAAPIAGYLPLALVSSRLFGRFLVSLPYLDRAGVVAVEPAVASALVDAAVRLAGDVDADYLELRQEQALEHSALLAQRSDKARMIVSLPATLDALWQQTGSKVRNQVRKGELNGLAVQWGGAELLREFYAVFAANMRDLGTPVFPRRLFSRVLQTFPTEAELAVVRQGRRAVAAAVLVHDEGGAACETHVRSAGSLRHARQINANMWMYYQLLARAVERGSQRFDFGRCTIDSPTYRFKQQWGAEPHGTVWQYHVRRGSIDAARPFNPRFARAIALWRRLPVALTRCLGPLIARGLP